MEPQTDEKIEPDVRKRLIEGEHEHLLEFRRIRQEYYDNQERMRNRRG